MNDRAVELLEQYEIEVLRTRKGRGAFLCETDKGCMIFKEYDATCEHIRLQDRILKEIAADGSVKAEEILPTKEGELLVTDRDGVNYVLKTRPNGRECAILDKGECVEAVRQLAKLHRAMGLPDTLPDIPTAFSPAKEYEKHNREIRKVKKYLKQKGQKQLFEVNLLKVTDFFLNQGTEVAEEWAEYEQAFSDKKRKNPDRILTFCHGDYQYHNILCTDNGWFLTNFEKCLQDDPIRDLALFLRKILEKTNWSVSLGQELLHTYEKERSICAESRIDLYYRLAYPEKFWKIANFYYNSAKAWIPGKNQEKLDKLIEQENRKQEFLTQTFRNLKP